MCDKFSDSNSVLARKFSPKVYILKFGLWYDAQGPANSHSSQGNFLHHSHDWTAEMLLREHHYSGLEKSTCVLVMLSRFSDRTSKNMKNVFFFVFTISSVSWPNDCFEIFPALCI